MRGWTRHIRTSLGLLFVAAWLLVGQEAKGQTSYYWNGGNTGSSPAGGGTGNWATANAWRTVTPSGNVGTWAAAALTHNGFLEGTAGTISLGTNETANFTGTNLTVNANGYTITTSAASRNIVFSGTLNLANSVGFTLTNSGMGGNTNSFGSIAFGSGSSLTIQGVASANNVNRVNLTSAGTISGGSITLAGTGAGVTGFTSTVSLGSGGVTLNTNITNDSSTSATLLGATNGNLLTFGGVVSGSANLQISAPQNGGAGITVLSNTSNFTGNTYLNGSDNAVLRIGVANALPIGTTVFFGQSAGGGTAATGGSIDLNGLNLTIGALDGGSATRGVANNTATLSTLTIGKSSGANSFAGNIGTVTNSNMTTQSNNIALVKTGASTQILTGVNTYTGGTSINGGTLAIGNASALGTTGTISFGGGTLQYSGITTDLSARFSTAANQQYRIDTNGQSVSFGTALTSSGGTLTKLGSGTLTLAVAATYTGETRIENGTLSVQHNVSNVLPTSTVVTLGSGTSSGILRLGTDSGSTTVTVGGLTTSGTGANNAVIGGLTSTGTFIVNANSDYTFAGRLGGSGTNENNFNFRKNGTGTLTLTGTNTFTGSTQINNGILSLGSSGALSSGSGTITFGGGTLQHSASNTTDYSSRFSTAASQQYRIDTNGQSVSLGNALTSSGGTLTKLGTGTLTLNAANTYTGATTVSDGTLSLSGSGSFANSPTVNVNSGAILNVSAVSSGANFNSGSFALASGQTLRGQGTVTGSTLVRSGATLSPGLAVTNAAPGTLTVNGTSPSVTMASGSKFAFYQNTTLTPTAAASNTGTSGTAGTINNLLSVNGTFSVADVNNLTILLNGDASQFNSSQSYSFLVVTATNSISPFSITNQSQFDTSNFTNFSNQFTFTLSSTGGNSVYLNLTPVPEPGTVLAVGAAGLGLAGLWRRKFRKAPTPTETTPAA